MSATPDSTLANPEGRVADLERQLAEREAELAEAREQQTATAEVLQVINSSPGDLAPVFDAMLEKAMRLCGAAFGYMRAADGATLRTITARGVPPAFSEFMRTSPIRPEQRGIAARIRAGESIVQITDLMDDELYREGDPQRRAMVHLGGARTLLAVALRRDDEFLGLFMIYRQEVRPFTDKQIALLQNFASQAVIAMENARLLTETREALERQKATAEVLGVINSSPGDLAPVFNAMLEKGLRLCDAAFGNLWTYDGEASSLAAISGASPEYRDELVRMGPQKPEHGGALIRLVEGEPLLHIADITAEDAHRSGAAVRRMLAERAGARTVLWVPMRKDGALLGFFTIYRTEVHPFTDQQIALLQNFAAQAVIAMENARLITETREALEQQTATAEVLGIINSSPGDLAPVFDTMLEKATRLCEAARGQLATYDGESFRFVAAHGEPSFVEGQLAQQPRPPAWGVTWPLLVAGERLVHIPDIVNTDLYRAGHESTLRFVQIGGGRSLLTVSLRKDDALLGALTIYRHEVRPFSNKEIALVQNFAAQAVIAMENARLITETREALEQQTATAEVLQVINSSPGDLTPVFDAMLEKAMRLSESRFGFLSTYDGERFTAAATRGLPQSHIEAYLTGPYLPGPNTTHDRLVRGEPVVHVPNLALDAADSPRRRAVVEVLGVRSILAVPLRNEGILVGALHVYRQEVRPFSDKEITLLQNFAAQAVIAMENARLLGELRSRTEEVGALNRDLQAKVAAQVEELGRVGRLKRFLAPQLAELIVSQGDEKILESHRREIVVVFCDLRGYTAFTETAEPEEVLDFLREYHGALGPLVSQFEGTLDQFSGDGIMVFFNDPVPIPDAAERAVNMAVAMRDAAGTLIADWRERGRELGFGAGIAQGYATLGQIGFSERSGYTAIGTVCNVAARLCAEAKDGQILLSQRVAAALKGSVPAEQVGALALKGLTQPVVAYNVPLAAAQLALRLIEGGPQTVEQALPGPSAAIK